MSREERAQIAAQRNGRERRADLGVYQPNEKGSERPRPSRRPEKRKKPRSKRTGLKICVFFVAIVLLGSYGIFQYIFKDYKPAENFSKKELAVSSAAPGGLQHIAIFGVDTYDGVTGRADSTMILTVDTKHRQIKLTSIQRDSYLPVKGHGNDKLTHAFAYGGAELMLHTINTNFDMNVTEYVVLDYKDVADMVDMVGGLTIDISEGERREINRICREMDPDCELLEEAGEVHLDGLQVTAYARIRKIDSETQRTARQRHVIGKLVEKLKAKPVTEYPQLLQKLAAVPTCSMTKGELAGLAMKLVTCDTEIRQYVIPSEEDHAKGGSYDGFWCWRYDVDAAAKRWHEFLEQKVPSSKEEISE